MTEGERRGGTVGIPLEGVSLRVVGEGFFKTGDVGRWDEDGYLVIVGRSKDVVIPGGLNVYPREVEEIIDGMPGVAESAVIGASHPDFGEAVTAVVVRRNDEQGAALDEGAAIGFVKGTLAGFKVPKRVHFTDELPRNSAGKVPKERFATEVWLFLVVNRSALPYWAGG